MKLSPILIAAAVAFGGTAIAQTRDSGSQAAGERTTAGGVVDKGVQGAKRAGQATKRGAQRAADATRSGAKRAAGASSRVAGRGADTLRNTGQSIERRLPPAPQRAQVGQGSGELGGSGSGAATTMGAGRADDRGDSSRQQRMDDAYGNWQRQQR